MSIRDQFSREVEELVSEAQIPYMDAIIICAAKKGLEMEAAARLCNKNIKERLEIEAQELHFIPKPEQLPL
tara:strand:+ start:15549 stop:15761 length:213 start_codon:yes stop_codon:yes gene_type:complete